MLGVADPSSGAGTTRLHGIEENPEALDELRRKALTLLNPALAGLHWMRLPCTRNNGDPGYVVLLRVEKSDEVHSIVDDGTWTRLTASNREMNAGEIADLHYRRGVRSAVSEPVPVAPNIDADEGVRMMFAEILAAKLYSPNQSGVAQPARTASRKKPRRKTRF